MTGRPIAFDVYESEPYSWTMAHRAAHQGLAEYVSGYTGYVERSVLPLSRREVAKPSVVLIISFGEPIDVRLSSDRQPARHTSFVAGLHDGFAVTEHTGRQRGIQVDLTPLGAFRLLGVPPSEFAHQVVQIDALSSRLAGLADPLASAPDWPARFDLLDHELLRWATEGPEEDPAVAWAWRQLCDADGRMTVGVLADEIGWSRRHFVSRFRHYVGLPPKSAGRILRFERAVQLLGADRAPNISAVAAACGFADHSHLVRDFHDLAGCTPTALLGAQLPDGGGFAGGTG
ncbi:MAG: helix-turn-helix domain-containing protein [Acidimicrobiales bacterium]